MQSRRFLRTLFEYKAWANEDLFEVLERLSDPAHAGVKHEATRILNHVYIVDRMFASNMQGLQHGYTAVNTPDTPNLGDLRARVRKMDRFFVEYTDSLTEAALAEPIDFTFVDGSPGCMTREEMLAHVVTHGNYHRGGIGVILSQGRVPLPRDTQTDALTVFLHKRRRGQRSRRVTPVYS